MKEILQEKHPSFCNIYEERKERTSKQKEHESYHILYRQITLQEVAGAGVGWGVQVPGQAGRPHLQSHPTGLWCVGVVQDYPPSQAATIIIRSALTT